MAQREHKAEPGDLIEIFRPGYQHWAVYVGDDEVVHLTTPDNMGPSNSGSAISSSSSVSSLSSSSSGGVAQVKRENIWDVVGHDLFRVNNLLDDNYKPRDPRVIVKEACKMVGKKVRYSATAANCEHFVTELRYGRAMSGQVINALLSVASVAGAGVLIVTAVAAPELAAVAVSAISWLFKKS